MASSGRSMTTSPTPCERSTGIEVLGSTHVITRHHDLRDESHTALARETSLSLPTDHERPMATNDRAYAPQSDRTHDDAMGTTFSSPDTPTVTVPRWSLHDLHEELLATVARYLAPRDVEALTVASKVVARDVLPQFSVWKELFCYRWNMWNFALEKDPDSETVAMEIDERLKAVVPSGCSESRLYQLLAHAVTPVPSFADVRQTERGRYFSHADHAIEAIGNPLRRRTLDVAYAGRMLGGDRCVRANAPFVPTFRVAVYAVANDQQRKTYRVGLATSGYFEVSIRPNPTNRGRAGRMSQLWRGIDSDMTSIGLALSAFPLIDKQPGWDEKSVGYHGDDGYFFHRNVRGRRFASPFGVGDTVGCGLRRDLQSGRSFVYFTKNGEIVRHGDAGFECAHASWFPVVGIDSHEVIHFNFGQEPFVCSGAADALFEECNGQHDLLTSHLSWYNISDSDAETSGDELSNASEESLSDDDSDEDNDFEMGYDRLSDMSELAMYMNQILAEAEAVNDADEIDEDADHDEPM